MTTEISFSELKNQPQCYNCGSKNIPPKRPQPKGTDIKFCSDKCERGFVGEVRKAANVVGIDRKLGGALRPI